MDDAVGDGDVFGGAVDPQAVGILPGFERDRVVPGLDIAVGNPDISARGDVDGGAIGGRAPFNAAERAAGAHDCAPDDLAVSGIQCPVYSALLPETDDVPNQVGSGATQVVIGA